MAEIDPVILQLRADVDRYIRDMRRAQGDSDRRLRDIENSFRRSSDGISTSLKGIAGTLATAFTGRELVGLIDSYTRLQNSLKVTGLEGEKLAEVQGRLFAVAQQNGVELEAVGQLYSRAAQNQKELGASTGDLIGLTRAVSASLRISGTSTQEASGALLQLGQALGSPRIQAEEFNSLLDTMQPLLREAAKNIEGTGGSLAGLTQRIKDTNGPGVSNVELFRAINQALVDLEKQAASSQLTLAGAFATLNNALTTYVGEAATANGVTGALATGIQKLADNLDTIIPALATIATILGVRLVAGAVAATGAAIGLRVVALGLAVQLNGVAAAATLAGRSLLAAFGGAVGVAIGAITIAFVAFSNSARGAEAATGSYKAELESSRKATDSAREAAERLASAHGKTRDEALRAATAERELTKQKLAGARASLVQAQAELKKAQAFQVGQNQASFGAGGVPGTGAFIQGRGDTRVATARSNVDAAGERIKNLQGAIATLDAAIAGTSAPAINAGGAVGAGGASGGSTGGGPSGPSAADRLNRFLDEQARLDAEILQSKINLATSIEDRAAAEREFLSFQGDQRRADIDAQVQAKELTAEQGAAPKAQIDALYGTAAQYDAQGNVIATYNNSLIAQELRLREQADLERQRLDILEEQAAAEIEGLRLQFDLADTEAERRRIALQILDAEERLALAREEEVLQSLAASEEAKRIAQLRKDAIISQSAARRDATERQFDGPLARYARNAKDVDTRVAEAAARRIEDLNDTIANAMTDALGIKDPFLSQLIKIFLDKNVFGPLAEALSSQGGGGGGFLGALGSVFGGMFGRASGGRVNAGGIYRVNEGASPGRVEAFVPNTSGQIIPLGRMNAMQAGGGAQGGTVRVVIEEAPGFAARVRTEAAGVALEVVRQFAPQIVDAAANETFRRANRPGL